MQQRKGKTCESPQTHTVDGRTAQKEHIITTATTVCKSLVVLLFAENSFVWYVIQYCIQFQRNSATGCRGKSTVTTVRNPINN